MKTTITADLMKRLPEGRDVDIYDDRLPGFVLRVRKSGTATWRVMYGRGKWYTIGKAEHLKPHEARAEAQALLGRAAKGEDLRASAKRQKAKTLRDYLKNVYGPWVKANRRDGKATLARLTACFDRELGGKRLHEVSAWVVEKWRSNRLKAGKATTTCNRDVTALKSALQRALDWGLLDVNPLAKVKPLKVDATGRVRFLSDAEEQRLRAALERRDHERREARERTNTWRAARSHPLFPSLMGYTDHLAPMTLVALNTGLRRGELFNLEWRDVDVERRILTVRGEGAKSAQTRYVPLNKEARRVLRAWKGDAGLVFPGQDGARLDNIKKAWANLMEAAGITGFRFHDLRHTFASKLVMGGVDLNTVRELLGHADLQMTLRYAHLAPEHKHAAVAVLEA
ncbi:MAG: site-specific integrase [Gammaproteobacteria bacterium]|nr:site-specific integrase [Gammaproteobacteria bacterium]